MEKFSRFARIAETEFSQIVVSTQDLGHKLRVYLKDKSFVDFFYTTKTKTQRFAIHWERTHIDKSIYRVDNMPDPKWKAVKTYPIHFHLKEDKNVKELPFKIKTTSLDYLFRSFFKFVSSKLN